MQQTSLDDFLFKKQKSKEFVLREPANTADHNTLSSLAAHPHANPHTHPYYNQHAFQTKNNTSAVDTFGLSTAFHYKGGINSHMFVQFAQVQGKSKTTVQQHYIRKKLCKLETSEAALMLPFSNGAHQSQFYFENMKHQLKREYIVTVQQAPNSDKFLIASSNGTVKLVHYDDYLAQKTSVVPSQNSRKRFLITSSMKKMTRCVLETGKNQVSAAKWKDENTVCISFASQNKIGVYDMQTGKLSKMLEVSSDVFDIELDKKSQLLCGCRNGAMQMMDLREKQLPLKKEVAHVSNNTPNNALLGKLAMIPKLGSSFSTKKVQSLVQGNTASNIGEFGAINSLQVSECGNLGYAGTENGYVVGFDLRRTSGVVRSLYLPSLIDTFQMEMESSIGTSLQKIYEQDIVVPQNGEELLALAHARQAHQQQQRVIDLQPMTEADFSQTIKNAGIQKAVSSFYPVQSIVLNPIDSTMLAVQMGNGFVCYLDLLSKQLVKLYYTSNTTPLYESDWSIRKRVPCFLSTYSNYNSFLCLPSSNTNEVTILDWSMKSPEIYREYTSAKEHKVHTTASSMQHTMLVSRIPTMLPVSCLANHVPSGDLLCGMAGNICTSITDSGSQ